MFDFLKSKSAIAKRLAEKRRKVKALAQHRGIHLRESNFEGIAEDLLDLIITANYFNDVYFADFGVDESFVDSPVSDPTETITDDDVASLKEEAYEEAARAREEFSTPSYTPEPTPEPEPSRSSSWGGDSGGYSSSDSSGGYSSSDSGSSSYD